MKKSTTKIELVEADNMTISLKRITKGNGNWRRALYFAAAIHYTQSNMSAVELSALRVALGIH